jgi:predicted ATPase/DNA-binding winged helix-turn-helix (wHTH) protein
VVTNVTLLPGRGNARAPITGAVVSEDAYCFGAFRLLPRSRVLFRGEEIVPLGLRTLSVLIVLIERRDRVVTKGELYAEVWGATFVEERNLTVQISMLRKALGRDIITTIPGRGYKFQSAVTLADKAMPIRDQPALVTEPCAATPKTNLPQTLTPMIGREIELAELENDIARRRLVTLVGPGGIGKTRLALDFGWRMLPSFADGVWQVDLAPVTSADMVTAAAATALGIPLRALEAPIDSLASALRRRQILLIFDNCDYVAAGAAELVTALLARVPGLTVLATSQEVLQAPAETVYRLAPLTVPPIAAANIVEYGAVRLFVERGRAADRHFRLDADRAEAVAEICQRLDGLPLALEMAAALLPLLGVNGIRSALDDRLHMLIGATRNAETRHRTLRAMMEWSHGLLDPEDRQFFRRLGIFPSNFSLDAAIAVSGPEGAEKWQTSHALGRLIGKSLLTVETGEPPRYRLLETLRLYAREKLAASDESDGIAERHAGYFTTFCDSAEELWQTTPDAKWVERYRPDLDNIRTALQWALAEPARSSSAISLAGTAGRLWHGLGLLAEGRSQTDIVARLIDPARPTAAAGRLLHRAATLWYSSDHRRTLTLLEQGLSISRQINDKHIYASILCSIGIIYTYLGYFEESKIKLTESYEIQRRGDRKKLLCDATATLGVLANMTNDRPEARRRYESALDLARGMKDVLRENNILLLLAELEFACGEVTRAIERGREAVRVLRSIWNRDVLGTALGNLASYLIADGKVSEARATAAEALSLDRHLGGYVTRIRLQLWALLGALDGRCIAASRLVGFVEAGYARGGEIQETTEQQIYDRLRRVLASKLTEVEIQAYAAEGAGWSEDYAVDFAFDHLVEPSGSNLAP